MYLYVCFTGGLFAERRRGRKKKLRMRISVVSGYLLNRRIQKDVFIILSLEGEKVCKLLKNRVSFCKSHFFLLSLLFSYSSPDIYSQDFVLQVTFLLTVCYL